MPHTIAQEPGLLQLILVFIVGALLAALANCCVDRLDWVQRFRSPWRPFPKDIREKGTTPKRTWSDRIPVWGWVRLSRFAFENTKNDQKNLAGKKHSSPDSSTYAYAWIPGWESRFFWVRPALVEIFFAFLITWRFNYWASLLGDAPCGPFSLALVVWIGETLLFWLALAASLVDLDDYVIPDALILPGVILALAFAAAVPRALAPPINMPIIWPLDLAGEQGTFSFAAFAANLLQCNDLEPTLNAVRVLAGGGLTLVWSFWAFAVLDRRFYWRFGFKRACALFFRRIRRSVLTPYVVAFWVVGLMAIWGVVWNCASLARENAYSFNSLDALANAFVGLLVGAGLIWMVRLIGGLALGVEAMGFGDVVLTAMLGAFIGWQGVVAVFFLAPFFGLVFGLLRRWVNTAPEIPYGPFLCLATLLYVIRREQFNALLAPYFGDPLFVLALGCVGFGLLAVALFALRLFKRMRNRG